MRLKGKDTDPFQHELRKVKLSGTGMEKLIFDPPLDFGIIYAARKIMEDTGIMHSLSILVPCN
ncbi:MAG: hypothetical protein M1476_05305 [Candidatus Thermoplasmatota archaeon]|nr:hypothetical protein [Candidatus Thermoplasmatota archaeon]